MSKQIIFGSALTDAQRAPQRILDRDPWPNVRWKPEPQPLPTAVEAGLWMVVASMFMGLVTVVGVAFG